MTEQFNHYSSSKLQNLWVLKVEELKDSKLYSNTAEAIFKEDKRVYLIKYSIKKKKKK